MRKLTIILASVGLIYLGGVTVSLKSSKHVQNELISLKEQRKEAGIKILANYLDFKRGIKNCEQYASTCDSLDLITSSLDSSIYTKSAELDQKIKSSFKSWAYLFE